MVLAQAESLDRGAEAFHVEVKTLHVWNVSHNSIELSN